MIYFSSNHNKNIFRTEKDNYCLYLEYTKDIKSVGMSSKIYSDRTELHLHFVISYKVYIMAIGSCINFYYL